MTGLSIILSFLVGSLAGVLYGLSFLTKRISFYKEKKESLKKIRHKKFFTFFLSSALRIILIGCLWYYILRTQSMSIILVLLSFLMSFWIIIIKKKVRPYERF